MFAMLILAALCAFSEPIQAMPQPETGAQSSSQLSDTPVMIEELGVSILPPLRSALSRERGSDGLPSVTIADASPTPVWQIRVQALIPELQNPTPELLIQDHIAKLKEAGHELTVLNSKEVTISGVKGWQAFMSDMQAEEPLVNGYLIMPGQGPPYVVVSFVCAMLDFPQKRAMLEAALASVKIDSPQRISDEREARLKAGTALIASFDTATLRSLIGLDQWFRHYSQPSAGAGGEENEIGVSHIWVREGKRGELSPEREPSQYDKSESQDGLLLTVQARIVVERDRDRYYDTMATYWMAWDDSVEAWSIVASLKQKGSAVSEAETGFRMAPSAGTPGTLQVVKSGAEGANRAPKKWATPEYYLSQPYSWLLGHLMASNNVAAGDYSFYAYDSSVSSLSLRQDSWLPTPGGNGAGTLTTRLTTQAPPVTSEYDSDGNLIKRTRPDGSITEPTTIDAIRKLWSAKGLKLGGGS